MIPTVKTWSVNYISGDKTVQTEILAPTKFLAKLNFHHEIGWYEIVSIGLISRKK